MFKLNVDLQSVDQMVMQQGYQHELLEAETEDGYVLQLDRIRNQ
jgi:hypothetical protein